MNTTVEQESPFDGTTDGNVLVFGIESESAEVTPENLEALQGSPQVIAPLHAVGGESPNLTADLPVMRG
jgi:hypothetical protein